MAAFFRNTTQPAMDKNIMDSPPILFGNPDFQPEKLTAYEAGVRMQPSPGLSFSVSAYYDEYDDLRTVDLTNGALPITWGNGMEGHTYGLEAWSQWQPTSWWRLSAGLNLLREKLRFNGDPNVIGKTIPGWDAAWGRTIIGVMPPDFWVHPSMAKVKGWFAFNVARFPNGRSQTLARLKPGVDRAQEMDRRVAAEAEVQRVPEGEQARLSQQQVVREREDGCDAHLCQERARRVALQSGNPRQQREHHRRGEPYPRGRPHQVSRVPMNPRGRTMSISTRSTYGRMGAACESFTDHTSRNIEPGATFQPSARKRSSHE